MDVNSLAHTSTFYNWGSRCRKAVAAQISVANYSHLDVPRPKQDVVPIDIVHSAESARLRRMQSIINNIPDCPGNAVLLSVESGYLHLR